LNSASPRVAEDGSAALSRDRLQLHELTPFDFEARPDVRYTRSVPISFEEKAWENLRAAEHLLPTDEDDSLVGQFPNAAASRAYYAAYLAVAHRAQADARTFNSADKDYYTHHELPDRARAWGLLDEDGCERLELLLGTRVKADYLEDHVSILEADGAVEIAQLLVSQLLGAEVSP